MIKVCGSLLIIFITTFPITAQDYLWPVEVRKSISSNYGEYRPRRFHAGIDIKTNSTTGHKVIAVDDGYIWRVKVSSGGYGRVLYLQLKDGNIAVYAHLDSFIPILDEIITIEQKKRQSYSVDVYFEENEFPIQKGYLLGYSGDSGGAFAPHLHFELRDSLNRPLNPLSHGFEIRDKRLPVPEALAVVPLSKNSVINGSPLPQIFSLRRTKTNEYEFPDTIHVFGKIGLEISTTDHISGNSHSFNIYGAVLFIDGIEHYRIEFDRLPFEQSQLIEVELDNSLKRLNDGEFHRLFTTEASSQLDFINKKSGGTLNLSPGYHRIAIKLYDAVKNLVRIKGFLYSTPPTDIKVAVSEINMETVTFIISPIRSSFPITNFICYSFNKNGFVEQNIKSISMKQDGRNLIVVLPEAGIRNRILQFIGISKTGTVSRPFHLPTNIQSADYVTVDLTFSSAHLENSVVLQVETDEYITQHVELAIVGNGDKRYPMKTSRVTPTTFLTDPLDPTLLKGVKEVIVSIPGSPVRETHFAFKPAVSETKKPMVSVSPDGKCSVRASGTTFYDTTVFWIENVEQPVNVEGGIFMSQTYQLQPFDRPLQDSVRIAIALDQSIRNASKIGVFYYDQKENWTYLPCRFSEKKYLFYSSAYSLEAVTLIEDTVKPLISNVFPGNGGFYRYQDVETISAHIEDALAGIKDENALWMILDDKRLLCEYHPIKKNLSHRLDVPLTLGKHTLFIRALDQVGNVAIKEISFSVD